MSGDSITNNDRNTTLGNVRIPLLVPLGLGLVVLLGTCLFTLHKLQSRFIEELVGAQVSNTQGLFQDELKKDAELLQGLTDCLKADENLRAAWSVKDRQMLLGYARSILEDIGRKYRVTHFYFHKPDRVCFLRAHEPSRHGDYIDRFTMDQAASSGEVAWGIELGPLGTFTLRVVCPWLIDGEPAGYIELGEEIEHPIDNLIGTGKFPIDFIQDHNRAVSQVQAFL